jgi:hypothetical protein
MSFNVSNFGYIWFGVRAQNLLRWMAVENRCGLGVRRVDKYSQSHIWTDDGRTLGRGAPHYFTFKKRGNMVFFKGAMSLALDSKESILTLLRKELDLTRST